jgi:hypothetical protein
MSIALNAVIIFVLLLPPFVFFISLTHGRFQKGWPRWNMLEMLMASAIFAIGAHAIALLLIDAPIRFDLLALILTGSVELVIKLYSNEEIEYYLIHFIWYCLLQLKIAFIIGKIVRWILNKYGLHTRTETFRLYNHWWYLFNGYKNDKGLYKKRDKPFDMVILDLLINTSTGAMIYSGYLSDFICSGETLDRIYLTRVLRRDFKTIQVSDKATILINVPGISKSIKSDVFSISFKDIINMNMRFVDFKELKIRR